MKAKEETKSLRQRLSPCPFCGKIPRINRPESGRVEISCCHGTLLFELPPTETEEILRDALVARWNHRV